MIRRILCSITATTALVLSGSLVARGEGDTAGEPVRAAVTELSPGGKFYATPPEGGARDPLKAGAVLPAGTLVDVDQGRAKLVEMPGKGYRLLNSNESWVVGDEGGAGRRIDISDEGRRGPLRPVPGGFRAAGVRKAATILAPRGTWLGVSGVRCLWHCRTKVESWRLTIQDVDSEKDVLTIELPGEERVLAIETGRLQSGLEYRLRLGGGSESDPVVVEEYFVVASAGSEANRDLERLLAEVDSWFAEPGQAIPEEAVPLRNIFRARAYATYGFWSQAAVLFADAGRRGWSQAAGDLEFERCLGSLPGAAIEAGHATEIVADLVQGREDR